MKEPLFVSSELAEVLGLAAMGEPQRAYLSVSIDSRAVEPGALFVALQGERHDAVEFLGDAEKRGAFGAIVPADREIPATSLELFRVPSTGKALQQLGAYRRRLSQARVVGITGSSGKTTVKEMVARALSTTHQVYKTSGNLNSLIGMPLAILDAPLEADVWVLELGASEPGEIARLTAISRPRDAVVTTVGPAHLEWFGDIAGVMREKLALVEGADPSGAVVVGEHPPELAASSRDLRPDRVVAGTGELATWRPDTYELDPHEVRFERAGTQYRIPVGGRHHLLDGLLAAALADQLGVPGEAAAAGLAEFEPLGMRSSLQEFGDLTVLVDCYNANPESFTAAIDYCATAFPDRRLVAFVGTMLELGDVSAAEHRNIAEQLLAAGFSLVAATGEFMDPFRELNRNGTKIHAAADLDDLWAGVASELEGDEVVLVKASRGVRLEGIVDKLRAFAEGAG